MDTWAAALATMTLYTAVRAARFGDDEDEFQLRWYVLFGLGLGLTVASRINVVPLAPLIGVAGLIWLVRRGHTWESLKAEFGQILNGRWSGHLPGSLDVQQVLLGGLIAALVFLATFRVAQPYAFADSQIIREAAPGRNGARTRPAPFGTRFRYRLQPPMAGQPGRNPAAARAGSGLAARAAMDRPAGHHLPLDQHGVVRDGAAGRAGRLGRLLLGAVAHCQLPPRLDRPPDPRHLVGRLLPLYGHTLGQSIRYMLPIYPTLLLLAAWALWRLWQVAGQNQTATRRLKQAGAAALILVTMSGSLLWANAFVSTVYGQPLTRNAASEWIYEHVPTGATLFYEAEGQTRQLQLPLRQFTFVPGGGPLTLPFELPVDGLVTAVQLNYLSVTDPSELGQAIELHFGSTTAPSPNAPLA
jgi:hypothetical protein